jgi:thymidylate kinase
MTDSIQDRQPLLVSFSGIDGSGKSTQIDSLQLRLRDAGLRVRRLEFWDDIAVLRQFREFSRSALFKGDTAVGAPGKPVNRRDKNVQTWYMHAFRFFLYFLDAIWLNVVAIQTGRSNTDVVIYDRYLYDELANLPMRSRITRTYILLLLKLASRPDIAFLLDADPEQARERKPEYPIEFVRLNRDNYLALSRLCGMTVISPGPTAAVEDEVMQQLLKRLSPVQCEAIVAVAHPAVAVPAAAHPIANSSFGDWQRVSGL